MSFVDIIIIIVLISGGIVGATNGFFKQTVILIGTIACFLLAWFLKDPIANFLSFNLPFFNFNGLKSLNIVFYQLASFLALLALFTSVLVVLAKITGVFEKILKITIVLGIPSKILGFVVGLIETYIIVFAFLFFAKQPALNQELIEESTFTPVILESSPGLSNIVENYGNAIKDIFVITKDYETNKNSETTNKNVIDALLKHKVVNHEYIDKLVKQGKIKYEKEEENNDKKI